MPCIHFQAFSITILNFSDKSYVLSSVGIYKVVMGGASDSDIIVIPLNNTSSEFIYLTYLTK